MSDALARVAPPDRDEIERAGRETARLIWEDDSVTETQVPDPDHPVFAQAVVDEFSIILRGMSRIVRKVMNRASSAAEDLNVEPFQGLIEVIQNADDLKAKEVRFALRTNGEQQQLLIVHDGRPVTCGHVLPMTLPFLTTKEEDAEQKGRFGIGLKTLARISSGLSVHSAQYHFNATRLSISNIDAEGSLRGFYNPATDTLLVLDLNSSFDEDALQTWFAQWSDDGLIFLSAVHRFRWCSVQGDTLIEKSVHAQPWKSVSFSAPLPEHFEAVGSREVKGSQATWTIYSADIRVPENLARAHKATGKSTPVSIAVSSGDDEGALYIAFKTRIANSMVLSIDAQFDPSTAREDLIDNAWNRWLVERCGDVLLFVANGLLIENPKAAWKIIPLADETLGSMAGRWPQAQFAQAFDRVKEAIGSEGRISMAGEEVMLNETAYEDKRLGHLLTTEDVERLAPGRKAILSEVRDESDRWRTVLDELGVSIEITTNHLVKGFEESLFEAKPMKWWIDAGFVITLYRPVKDVFGVPFLRSVDGRAVACAQKDTTSRPLVFGDQVSQFCTHWTLLDRLHDTYGAQGAGESLRNWLVKHAAYTIEPTAEAELAAFAEKFAAEPVEMFEADLRELRDRFGFVSDRRAADLGRRVGAAILLNGSTYHKGDKRKSCKVSPGAAYLPKTLDSEHPDWPEAADNLPGIVWLSAAYDEQLKLPGGRNQRRRDEGYTPRGARRFLMLLGAETAPRLVKTEHRYGGRPSRVKQLARLSAHRVEYDYTSPDLERMLAAFARMGKRDRKLRSAALMRALSHNWDRVYHRRRNVPAQQEARKYIYSKGDVAADWLCLLREAAWVVISNGDLRTPAEAVVRNPQTETLYETATFVAGLEGVELSSEFVATLGLITDVRARDLIAKLESLRAAGSKAKEDVAVISQIYRTLSKLCPRQTSLFADVGDMPQQEFRRRFNDSVGLICLRPGEWKRPNELFSGHNVFRQPELFVPSAPAYADLWRILEIRPPELRDCTQFCRQLTQQVYSTSFDAVLMDVYRYMESSLAKIERVKSRLVNLPLACSGQWVARRPVYFIEDRELRGQLAKALPGISFWSPPCDVRDLPHLTDALGIEQATPDLKLIAGGKDAQDEGENHRTRFQASVEHLSTELARHEVELREKLEITWDELRNIPLFVYASPFAIEASCPMISPRPVRVAMKALLIRKPLALHVWIEGFRLRDSGGRAIASLFASDVQRQIEAEWVASWSGSKEEPVEVMRLAADEEKQESLRAAAQELADKIAISETGKVSVSQPASRTSTAKPRRLKSFQGGITRTTVHVGAPPATVITTQTIPLAPSSPAPSGWPSSSSSSPAPVEYSNADLEQRGWEILLDALKTQDGPQLQDFRRRRGVGADGAIDWKKFIELKASGRSMPASIEMSNAEYERAKERGEDYILALVYGLEEGQQTEARLIFDPARSLILKPLNGIRLTGLSDATAVVVQFKGDAERHGG